MDNLRCRHAIGLAAGRADIDSATVAINTSQFIVDEANPRFQKSAVGFA
jgi:hypothetical protein